MRQNFLLLGHSFQDCLRCDTENFWTTMDYYCVVGLSTTFRFLILLFSAIERDFCCMVCLLTRFGRL